jgi:hypothetical protein
MADKKRSKGSSTRVTSTAKSGRRHVRRQGSQAQYAPRPPRPLTAVEAVEEAIAQALSARQLPDDGKLFELAYAATGGPHPNRCADARRAVAAAYRAIAVAAA